jgi:hypothetical protein
MIENKYLLKIKQQKELIREIMAVYEKSIKIIATLQTIKDINFIGNTIKSVKLQEDLDIIEKAKSALIESELL